MTTNSNGDPNYPMGPFASAVHGMARSEKSLRERLVDAVHEIRGVRSEDMPEGSTREEEFNELMAILGTVKAKSGEGTWRASLDAVREADVRRVAELICNIHTDLTFARRNPGPKEKTTMTFPVQIELGNHVVHAPMHALPRTGDRITCPFPASGIPRLFLVVTGVWFHEPPGEFDGRECPEPFRIVITTDGDPEHKDENDAAFKKIVAGKK